MSIDPGIHKCGIAIFHIVDGKLAAIEAFTIFNNKIKYKSRIDPELHEDRNWRLDLLGMEMAAIIARTNPLIVISESPFYSPTSPGAYGSLMETTGMFRRLCYEHNPWLPFIFVAPQKARLYMGIGGTKEKEDIAKAVYAIPEISCYLPPIDVLDQNAIDAVCIGYGWAKQFTGVFS